MTKKDTTSPTVSTEALLLSCVIDAIERRHVATCDIPGAFMQSNMKTETSERVTIKLEGLMAQLLLKISPNDYEEYTEIENGKPMLYASMKKALYGTLQAALLFYENLSGELKKGYLLSTHTIFVWKTKP